MVVIKNNLIPFKGYVAMAMFPFVFVRKEAFAKLGEWEQEVVLRHERIHLWQQGECLLVLFWLLYGVFYLINLVRYRSHKEAYRKVAFEREAYENQEDEEYAEHKPFWGWVWYVF